MNLLQETLEKLKTHALSPDDVAWVGSSDGEYAITWDAFAELAGGIEYDNGYGSQKIVLDLVVVLHSGHWFERAECDGSEWWEYKQTPVKTADAKAFTHLEGMWIHSEESLP